MSQVSDDLTWQQPSFFRNMVDCHGQPSICPKVKFLMALKLVCYVVSPAAFQDYFQMGISAAHECLKHFASIVSQDGDLNLRYHRRMNRADAHKLSDLHFFIMGCLEWLDLRIACMSVGGCAQRHGTVLTRDPKGSLPLFLKLLLTIIFFSGILCLAVLAL